MSYIGDFPEDFTTVPITFTTHAATGAAVAPSSAFETADVAIYKNGSATQKATTNGLTMTSPFDTVTGLHVLLIDTSNDTGDSGFWTTGAHYTVVLSPDETVDNLTVVKVIGTFSIGMNLRSTTNGRTLDVTSGGAAGIDWANVEAPTTTVGLSGTTVKTATDVETDTADIQSRIGTPSDFGSGTSTIAANLQDMADNGTATFDRSTDSLQAIRDHVGDGTNLTEAGGTGDHLTAINLPDQTMNITGDITGNLSGSVGSVTGAVGSVTGNVGGNVTGSVGSLATQAKADVNAEVDTAIADARLDELLAADSDIDGAAPPTVGSVFHELMSKTAGSFTYDQTTDSNEAIRDRGDASWITATGFSTHSAADIWAVATRVLTALDEDVTTLDLDATIRAAIGMASANLDTQLTAIDDYLDTEVAAIKAKTDQLTFTTANQVDATTVTNSDKTGYRLSATGVDDVLDEVVEGTTTLRQSIRLNNSAQGAKLSGAATTSIAVRDLADTKNRIAATVDADGNRSAVTLDLT